MRDPDTLYYDGSCPLCKREMSHLAKLKSDQLVLQDIHALPPGAGGPDKEMLLQNLHLKRGSEWVVGLDANVAAWQYTRIGFFWRWLSWPLVRPLASWCYSQWATRRYAKRYSLESESSASD
jgi:predicted DCC family thiol-disulfide oxidoreductase YuxK